MQIRAQANFFFKSLGTKITGKKAKNSLDM